MLQDIWNRLTFCKQNYRLSLKLPHIYSKAMLNHQDRELSACQNSAVHETQFALFCLSRNGDSEDKSSLKLHPIEREAKKNQQAVS